MLSFIRLTAPLAPVNHDVHVIETKGTSVNVTVWHASQTNGPIRYESSYNPLKILYNCKQVHKEKILHMADVNGNFSFASPLLLK